MKKKNYRLLTLLTTVALSTGYGSVAHAQTWDEWFHQDKTQKKYLLRQIAELQLYLIEIQKGFSIAQQGLSVVHQIKKGEFDLHNAYYSSLKKVNAGMLPHAKLGQISANQSYILHSSGTLMAGAKSSGEFTDAELALFTTGFSNLLADVNQTADQVTAVTTDGTLQMTDDERLKRIDRYYKQSTEQRISMVAMDRDIHAIALSRRKERAELQSAADW